MSLFIDLLDKYVDRAKQNVNYVLTFIPQEQ